MNSKVISVSRRSIMKFFTTALFGAAIAYTATKVRAQTPAAKLEEKDGLAVPFGYREDATKVDKAKFSKYQAGQVCSNCALFQGKASDATGGCAIFPGKAVSAKGWCNAWAKKS